MQAPKQLTEEQRRAGRALWIILGVVLGLVAIGVGANVVLGKIRGGFTAIQTQGDQVANGVLSRLKNGTQAAIWDEAAPEFQQVISREKLAALFDQVTGQVGRPVSWQVTGVNKGSFLSPKGMVTSTFYTYRVTHEKGMTTTTLRVDDQQRLLYVHFGMEP